jgi:glutaminyl-peptide cyclotransferase
MRRRIAAIIATSVFAGLLQSAAPAAATQPPRFNAERSWHYLCEQVNYGPRVPGSESIKKTRQLIIATLERDGFSTRTQAFRGFAPALQSEVSGVNIIGIGPGAAHASFVISAHYDTRPIADNDPDPTRRGQPIPGANDGASGVAVLLGLADALAATPPPHGVALVFFDVEDCGLPKDPHGYCLGSRFMAQNLPAGLENFVLGINLDMVGKKNLRLPIELNSLRHAPDEVFALWEVGQDVAPSVFVKQEGREIYDDHVPFLERGKKFINVIDFDYLQWHTGADSIEQCDSQSLKAVGDTLLRFLFQ